PLDDPEEALSLDYYCNNSVSYTLGGVHVELDIRWDMEPPAGVPDTEYVLFHGSLSRVEIRQRKETNWLPEVYILPVNLADRALVKEGLENRVNELQSRFEGLRYLSTDEGFRLEVPTQYRIGHEAHFSRLASAFLNAVRNPESMESWEPSNILAKY